MKRLLRSSFYVLLLTVSLVLTGCFGFGVGIEVTPPVEEPEPQYDDFGLPMAGRQLWLRADEGVEVADGRVVKWLDQSGNGNDAYANEPEKGPTLIETDEGYEAVYFDGTGYLVVPHDDNLNADDSFSVVVVLKSESGNRVMQKKSGDAGTSTDAWYFARARGLSVGGQDTGTAIMEGKDLMVVTNILDAHAGTITFYQDGEFLYQVSEVVPQVPNTDDLWLGLRDYGNPLAWVGEMYELFIFKRALTNEEQAVLEDYLMQKYGLRQ